MNSKYEYNVSHQNYNEPMIPNSVGTIHNLPDDVRTLAGLGDDDDDAFTSSHNDIVWTTFDTEFEPTISPSVLLRQFVVLSLMIPCSCLGWVCFWKSTMAQRLESIRHKYWILTDRDVKIVVLANDFDSYCCFPGRNNRIQSIPLKDITDCYLREYSPVSNVFNDCGGFSLPTLNIDTARSGKDIGHEAVGFGLVDFNWFMTEILRRRDRLMMELPTVPAASAMVEATCAVEPTTAMDRGSTTDSNESIERRMQLILDLHQRGMVTKEEYEMKRQEIIASI
jgi:hypothetical protein